MKKKLNYALSGVLIVIALAIVMWLLMHPLGIDRNKTEKLDGTELTVLEVETTFYGSEEVNVQTGYYLLNARGDTLFFQWAPYKNVKGIVYMMPKGVFDCRYAKPVLLIEQGEVFGNNFKLEAVEGKNEVLIQDVSSSQEYFYDLQTDELYLE